jgi:hypothetical protein
MRSGQFLSLVLLCCFTYINFNGCHWTSQTCKNAIALGRLEVLQWAHANYAPMPPNALMLAINRGQLETLKWLIRQARIHFSSHSDEYIQAARSVANPNLVLAQWLERYCRRTGI